MSGERVSFRFRTRKSVAEAVLMSFLAVGTVVIVVTKGIDLTGVVVFLFSSAVAAVAWMRVLRGPIVLDGERMFLPMVPFWMSSWPWENVVDTELFETHALSLFTLSSGKTEWLRVHLVDDKRMAVPLYLIYDRDGFLEAFADHAERFGAGAAGSGGEGGAD